MSTQDETYKDWIKVIHDLDDTCFPNEVIPLKRKNQLNFIEALVLWHFSECDNVPHPGEYKLPSMLQLESEARKIFKAKAVRKIIIKQLLPKLRRKLINKASKTDETIETLVGVVIMLSDEKYLAEKLINAFIPQIEKLLASMGVSDVTSRSSMD